MEKKLILDFDKKQKASKNKRKDRGKPSGSKIKQVKLDEAEVPQPSTSYRDRAQERREGLNKDFELDPDDLIISNPIIGTAPEDVEEEQDYEAERRKQQIEESKYLGGDVEHTHLVKGLDFALLEKVKNDQKLAAKLAKDRGQERDFLIGEPGSDSEEEEFLNEAILAASATSTTKRQIADIEKLKKGKSTEMIPCRTALARRILNVLDEKWPDKSELFLPGRMSYIVPIDTEDTASVTTILRSKADTSLRDYNAGPSESDFAFDQLVNILVKFRQRQ